MLCGGCGSGSSFYIYHSKRVGTVDPHLLLLHESLFVQKCPQGILIYEIPPWAWGESGGGI